MSADATPVWMLYVWLFVQMQVILCLLYAIVRMVLWPLCCGRNRDNLPPLSEEQVRRNFEELQIQSERKRAERAATLAARLTALSAPAASLVGMESAASVRLFRDHVAAHTLCPFSKKSVIWGDPVPAKNDAQELDAEALAALPVLAKWSLTAFASKLDGFLFARQLPRDRFVDALARPDVAPPTQAQIESGEVLLYNLSLWLRVTLHTLSVNDPAGDGSSCIVDYDDDF